MVQTRRFFFDGAAAAWYFSGSITKLREKLSGAGSKAKKKNQIIRVREDEENNAGGDFSSGLSFHTDNESRQEILNVINSDKKDVAARETDQNEGGGGVGYELSSADPQTVLGRTENK